ncbi:MAG: methyltransferase domain-containing protein [Pyrinomonadaceae bacterium]
MLDTTYNQSRADLFSESLLDVLNKSAIAIGLSLGHRTGLFDTMANLPASSSAAIAEAAGLDERYVREWLGTMVTGRVINYYPDSKTYQLPAEHAAFLTRESIPNNLAATMQYLPLLGSVEDQVLECFRHGGGVPYSEFPRFHEIMAEESAQTVVSALIDQILPLVPEIKDRLTAGIDVLDVGCGSGKALILLARTYPKGRYSGYDFSEEAVAKANAEAEGLGLRNIRFRVRDAGRIGEIEQYDLITAFDAIHDQAKPAVVLKEIFNALHRDGVFLMQDIAGSSDLHKNMEHPISPFLYTISYMHCMTVSLALDGAGLGTMWGEEKAREMLTEAGFTHLTVRNLEHDFINTYYIASKA